MACAHCQLGFVNDDFLICSGVCEKSFHGKLSCSGIKTDVARVVLKNPKHLKYVCEDCGKGRLFHVLESVKMCNDNITNVQSTVQAKLEEITALMSSFVRRVSVLETSVSDVTCIGDVSRTDDEFYHKIEGLFDRSISKITRSLEAKIIPIIDRCTHEKITNELQLLAKQHETQVGNLKFHVNQIPAMTLDLQQRLIDMDSKLCSLKEDRREKIDPPSITDIDCKIGAANDKLARELAGMEIRIKGFLNDMLPVAVDADPHVSATTTLATLNESCASFVTIDATGINEEETDDFSDSSQPIHEDEPIPQNDALQWIYVASADEDFGIQRLKNLILWNFGVDGLQLDLLSKNSDVTYKSLKVAVPSRMVPKFLDLRNWPKSYYVRKFDAAKRSVFPQGLNKSKPKRTNFVHNPLKLRN